ncbi:MAG: glycosyl hydrolase family 8 [Lachnospiraceae bacterium]|nr:glycosyl hydrolase family 8 [Lachnospiraceae bacterium]
MKEKKEYRNIFAELGYDKEEIEKRVRDTFNNIFYGPEGERLYYDVDDDMGFITDTGNDDVRTEGQSYAMMMCVQMNDKEKFDRIWKWTKTYMWMRNPNWNKGYFIWSCALNGDPLGQGPAPDGEEYFAMALFLASHRWGDGEGIFAYSKEARDILSACLHNGEPERFGEPMWNKENHLIKFITNVEFSDPSYHLPHFYECFAKWADVEDRPFWKKAAEASREYLLKACHPVTGLNAEYAHYDGRPYTRVDMAYGNQRHDWFYSDAYRTVANIAMDSEWCGSDKSLAGIAMNLLKFFEETQGGDLTGVFEIDGTVVEGVPAKHSIGLMATNAEGALAVYNSGTTDAKALENAEKSVRRLWETPLRTGKYRYYDNCLYLFAMLALSGNYRIY